MFGPKSSKPVEGYRAEMVEDCRIWFQVPVNGPGSTSRCESDFFQLCLPPMKDVPNLSKEGVL